MRVFMYIGDPHAVLNTRYLVYYWLSIYEPWNKKCLNLILGCIFEQKLLELAILSPTWPNFGKLSSENWLIWPKKSRYTLLKIQIKPILIPIGFLTLLHAKQPVFGSIRWFETKGCCLFKIWHQKFKTGDQIVLKLRVYMFWTDWEITRQIALGPGWVEPGQAGPVHHGYRLYSQRETLFV